MRELDIDVDLIQETKLKKADRSPTLPGYASIRRDRPGDSIGGAVLPTGCPGRRATGMVLKAISITGMPSPGESSWEGAVKETARVTTSVTEVEQLFQYPSMYSCRKT